MFCRLPHIDNKYFGKTSRFRKYNLINQWKKDSGMYWSAAILVVVSMVSPFAFGEPDAPCDHDLIYKEMRDLVTLVQDWKLNRYPEAYQMNKIGRKMEGFVKLSEGLLENCAGKHKEELGKIVTFTLALITGQSNIPETALADFATKNEMALDHILSLACALDCSYVLKYTDSLEMPGSKKHIYQTLTKLLQYSTINHTIIDTTLPFIIDLHKITQEETDAEDLEILKTLLFQAIKTDLVLQHHNLEALYGIDKEITSAVLQDLITENIHTPVESGDDLELFPLFEIVKCPDNLHLWVEQLEIILKRLQESKKTKSIYALILLKEVHYLEEKVNEEDQQKLLNIKNEIPKLGGKVLSGKVCIQIGVITKKYKAFLFNKGGSEPLKFVPKGDGSVTIVSAKFAGHDFTLLLERSDDIKDVFDFPVVIEHGVLEPLAEEEKCEANTNVCMQFADVLPTVRMNSSHFLYMQQFVKYYVAVSQSCSSTV